MMRVQACMARLPMCPALKRVEHVEHNVCGPFGPGPLPEHSSLLQSHHPHLQLPPSQNRLWPPRLGIVSNCRPHLSHGYLPSASLTGGPVAPAR